MLLEQFLAQSSSETLPPEVVGNKNRESQPGNVQREGDLGILIQIPPLRAQGTLWKCRQKECKSQRDKGHHENKAP